MEPIASGTATKSAWFKRSQLVSWLGICQSKKRMEQCRYLAEKVTSTMRVERLSEESSRVIYKFIEKYDTKWSSASRNKTAFENKNPDWLNIELEFSSEMNEAQPAEMQDTTLSSRGRPFTGFLDLCDRSKRRKTEQMRADRSPEELTFAAQMKFRSEGKLDEADVLKNVAFSSPTRASKYKKSLEKECEIPFSADEALSLFVEATLTKFQYNLIRNSAKSHKRSTLYPNYESITAAKKRCYPENLNISEDVAEVPLQSLLDHTSLRLFESLKEVLNSLNQKKYNNLNLICKWGCDGSSGMSQYKQQFAESNISDANIFLTSMVPIQLINGDPKSKDKFVIWENPKTSSTRLCRPLRVQFRHETTELSVREKQYFDQQISDLQPTKLDIQGNNVFLKHILYFTMIDGKLCNAVTENTSTQRCYLCNLTSKDFNNIDKVLKQKIADESRFQFGLSSLHAWIRFFECLLHLSYKMEFKQWQARGQENKEKLANAKKRIQDLFFKEIGLLVDRPKPGFGSTNDGNTARRFFENAAKASEITDINQEE
ncbi:uncharacterized protein LOC126747535 [Anthonomus grandis grandis]|uniref:uncharacterized protein LOC126747535 n=1 Tax=Anthonomus grandis grandis TaxID=2921223 RepID=UPI0021650500|nr:uncharacterized protein LOC126747535 [Anthonomus grandis grandis]